MKETEAQKILDKVKNGYNQIAEDFSHTRHRSWEEISFLFDYIKPNDKVLDAGCGNGRYLPWIKQKNGQYFGIDNSQELIKIAQSRYQGESFQMADVLALPFDNTFFDKIYSIAVLHHIPSNELRQKFFQEAKRVLKPNGFLVLTVWKFKRWQERLLLFKYNISRVLGKTGLEKNDLFLPWQKKIPRYYHFFSQSELKKLARQAGFEVIKTGIARNPRGNRNNIYLIVRKIEN